MSLRAPARNLEGVKISPCGRNDKVYLLKWLAYFRGKLIGDEKEPKGQIYLGSERFVEEMQARISLDRPLAFQAL